MINIKLNSKKPLPTDYFAVVDDGDHDLVKAHTWWVKVYHNRSVVYARTFVRQHNGTYKSIVLHRLIMGTQDPKIIVDHEDGNGLNCQRYNLREATFSENNANVGARKHSSSRFLGVYFHERSKKYVAQICKDKVNRHLGYFVDEHDAALAYDIKAIELHGKFAKLNFPQDECIKSI